MPEQDFPDLKLSEETRDAIALYLYNELKNSITARQDAEDVWKDIQKLYEQLDVPEKKDIPFEGAATVMIPIIPTYVEQLHARLMDTLYTPEDTYSVKPTRDELYKYSKAVRRWLTWAGENELNEEAVDYSALMELLKLGTMAQKVVYERQDVVNTNWNEATKEWESIVERMKDNPEYIHVSISDLFWQMHARHIDESEWKMHRIRLSWNEIKLRVDKGRYDAEFVEKIRSWYEISQTELQEVSSDEVGIQPSPFYEFELFECWFRYPLKVSTGESHPIDEGTNLQTKLADLPVRLQAVLHKDTQTLLSIKYNIYPLGLDPIEVMPFVGRELQVLGIGVGQMALPFQIEVTAMHNQRLDNATVVNSVSFKYKADSLLNSQLPLRPGGGIPVDEMDDLQPFVMGSKGDSTIDAEKHSLSVLQERIGIRELALDDVALGQAPATTTLAILQEKGRRLDNVLRTLRRFKKRMILKAVLLYKAYYPREKLEALFGEDGKLVAEMLDGLSAQQIWDGMGIEISATTSATSRELEKRSKMEMFNVLLGYYDKFAEFTIQAANPEMPPILQAVLTKMGTGLTLFVDELMADFNLYGRKEYLINIQQIVAEAEAAAAQQPDGGGVPPASGAVPPTGVPPAPQGTPPGGPPVEGQVA